MKKMGLKNNQIRLASLFYSPRDKEHLIDEVNTLYFISLCFAALPCGKAFTFNFYMLSCFWKIIKVATLSLPLTFVSLVNFQTAHKMTSRPNGLAGTLSSKKTKTPAIHNFSFRNIYHVFSVLKRDQLNFLTHIIW